MDVIEEQLVILVGMRAARRMEQLAGRLAVAPAAEREAIQAGIAFERWLLDGCLEVVAPTDTDGFPRF